jgi:hypothetical protein
MGNYFLLFSAASIGVIIYYTKKKLINSHS